MNEMIVNIDQENAQQYLIDESFHRPVLVDFWAQWCAPCRQLMPVLEALAKEYQGGFLLAKVNADEQPMIAGQLGVQSLPTVMLIREGRPVDMFQGALPEGQVRRFLEPHLPKPWEEPYRQGMELFNAGDYGAALNALLQARALAAEEPVIQLALAHLYLELNRLEDAAQLLEAIKMVDQDSYYQQLLAQLDLKRNAAKSPEIEALEAQVAEQPENLDAAYQLALQYSQHGHLRDGLALIFSVLQRDRDYQQGLARKTLLDMIKSLGAGDPLAVEYQRKLYSLLY